MSERLRAAGGGMVGGIGGRGGLREPCPAAVPVEVVPAEEAAEEAAAEGLEAGRAAQRQQQRGHQEGGQLLQEPGAARRQPAPRPAQPLLVLPVAGRHPEVQRELQQRQGAQQRAEGQHQAGEALHARGRVGAPGSAGHLGKQPSASASPGLIRAAAVTPPRRAASHRPGSAEGAAPLAGAGEAPQPAPRGAAPRRARCGPSLSRPAGGPSAGRGPGGDGRRLAGGGWRPLAGGARAGAEGAGVSRGRLRGDGAAQRCWVCDSQQEAIAPGKLGAAAFPSPLAPGRCWPRGGVAKALAHGGLAVPGCGARCDFWVTQARGRWQALKRCNPACGASVTANGGHSPGGLRWAG